MDIASRHPQVFMAELCLQFPGAHVEGIIRRSQMPQVMEPQLQSCSGLDPAEDLTEPLACERIAPLRQDHYCMVTELTFPVYVVLECLGCDESNVYHAAFASFASHRQDSPANIYVFIHQTAYLPSPQVAIEGEQEDRRISIAVDNGHLTQELMQLLLGWQRPFPFWRAGESYALELVPVAVSFLIEPVVEASEGPVVSLDCDG